MSTRFQISVLVYMMVQAVTFGIGVILVLATPLKELAMTLMPWVVGVSFIAAMPFAWFIAPRLRARYWRNSAGLEKRPAAIH
mgnify:CR=1 FL=1